MSAPKDLVGHVYGFLTVEKRLPSDPKSKRTRWLCVCKCGNKVECISDYIRSGSTTSCGCVRREAAAKLKKSHGMCYSLENGIWSGIKTRCLNKNSKGYKNYGGKGITISEDWLTFENFYRDMGPIPSKHHSIERIDNSKGYCKDNCIWATRTEQNRNTSRNIIVEYEGSLLCLSEWAEKLGIAYSVLHRRISSGWDIKLAFTTPVQKPGAKIMKSKNCLRYKLVECDGRTMSVEDWSITSNIPYSIVKSRLDKGWSMKEIISIPKGKHRSKHNS